ncbi:MAG: glycosyltransferase [Bacilli bacterium]|nr:glycosyltransferase [Bacilli bacterium]
MEKYTIVLLHYNQMKYIEEAIISIMNQTYKNVELIVADDCSPEFDYDKIEKIIKKYNKNNYEYKILTMKQNSGTVKNLNNAIKNATGKFIHFLASDDVLYDNNVITNFVEEFNDKSKDIITAQCLMCDDKLEKGKPYVNVKMAKKLNEKGTIALFEKMAEYCIYCAGATVYRIKLLKDNKLFDERYQYIEDWSSWLQLLEKGTMIYYVDFIAYKHRDGGISHSDHKVEIPNHVKKYYKELLDITVNDVFPYINKYKISEQYRIVKKFYDCANYFGGFVPELYEYNQYIDKLKGENQKFATYWRFRKVFDVIKINFIYKIKNLIKYNKVIPATFIAWVVSCFILNNYLQINNRNYILLIYILLYFGWYIIMFEIDKLFYLKKLIDEAKFYRTKNKKLEDEKVEKWD